MSVIIEIPKFCLGKCDNQEYRCCRCGTTLNIFYQVGDGKKMHSLCKSCHDKLGDAVHAKSETGGKDERL